MRGGLLPLLLGRRGLGRGRLFSRTDAGYWAGTVFASALCSHCLVRDRELPNCSPSLGTGGGVTGNITCELENCDWGLEFGFGGLANACLLNEFTSAEGATPYGSNFDRHREL